MGEKDRNIHASCIPRPAVRQIVVLMYLSLLVLMVVPVYALHVSPDAGMSQNPAGSSGSMFIRDSGAGTLRIAAAPVATIRLRPTQTPIPMPVRQSRTSVLQTIVKNAAERPRVMVPAFWFILVIAIVFIGLGAVLYLLIRGRRGASGRPGKNAKEFPGHETVIGAPAGARPPEGTPSGYPEPAIQFPPSLEKRFTSPVFIGEGGLARVFRAQNAKTQATVAVKIPVRFDEITGTHFTRDIVFWQGLEHENIIRIYSSNILPVPYIEMEYAPSSLATVPLPLPEEKAVGIILGIARGLTYAHDKGIIHRDIKPENILLTSDGIPKITDWGLGKAIGDTRQSSMIGFSPAYAAPEQIAPHRYGRPGPATDIYQIGMLLSEMLTGSPAFGGEGLHDLNMAILNDSPSIPLWHGTHETVLRKIIMKCLEKRPEDRYDSVAALIRDLEPLQLSS
jgi:Protein kinase domain